MSEPVTRRLVVHGHVQGVFFRAQTRRLAREHGVSGWVATRPDGTVEALLQGSADDVAAVEGWIRGGGPPRAAVDRVEADDVEATDHDSFEVRG